MDYIKYASKLLSIIQNEVVSLDDVTVVKCATFCALTSIGIDEFLDGDFYAAVIRKKFTTLITINEKRDLSQEFIATLLCHELGHILAKHTFNNYPNTLKEYIEREREANVLGLDLFTNALKLPSELYYHNDRDVKRMKRVFKKLKTLDSVQ
jgi:Zn-dependent peptidase ImmA (M78 family)